MPVSYPQNYLHPSFPDQREYDLRRAIIDTGDNETDATVILNFRHRETGRIRRFRFSGVNFAFFGGDLSGLQCGSYLPIYVATTQGRQWAAGAEIEIGNTDPGDEWFWASNIEEITDSPRQ